MSQIFRKVSILAIGVLFLMPGVQNSWAKSTAPSKPKQVQANKTQPKILPRPAVIDSEFKKMADRCGREKIVYRQHECFKDEIREWKKDSNDFSGEDNLARYLFSFCEDLVVSQLGDPELSFANHCLRNGLHFIGDKAKMDKFASSPTIHMIGEVCNQPEMNEEFDSKWVFWPVWANMSCFEKAHERNKDLRLDFYIEACKKAKKTPKEQSQCVADSILKNPWPGTVVENSNGSASVGERQNPPRRGTASWGSLSPETAKDAGDASK